MRREKRGWLGSLLWVLGFSLVPTVSATMAAYAETGSIGGTEISAESPYLYLSKKATRAALPANCPTITFQNFTNVETYFTYGIQGSYESGFDYEIDLSRTEAALLSEALQAETPRLDFLEKVAVPRRVILQGFHETLWKRKMTHDFSFRNEGDVLESLAIEDLKRIYPESDYFHFGGVVYGSEPGITIGELDLVVARRSDLKIIAVGEAKLGVPKLHEAVRQLRTFANFLRDEIVLISFENGDSQVQRIPHVSIAARWPARSQSLNSIKKVSCRNLFGPSTPEKALPL